MPTEGIKKKIISDSGGVFEIIFQPKNEDEEDDNEKDHHMVRCPRS
jgi:hypothetical protein